MVQGGFSNIVSQESFSPISARILSRPARRRFVNVRFSLRFVMVSVSDPNPVDDTEVDEGEVPESPGMTMSHALADVDIM